MGKIGRIISHNRILKGEFIRLREAARRLEVSPATLNRWLTEGKVEGVVWGRNYQGFIIILESHLKILKRYRSSLRRKYGGPKGPGGGLGD